MPQSPTNGTSDYWDELRLDTEESVEHLRHELSEVGTLIDQSQVEVNKLVARNSTISSHLQQVQANIDTLPRPDIRATYDAALESQQRLFVMRGQLEKLQSDKAHLDRALTLQQKMLEILSANLPRAQQAGGKIIPATAEKLEMVIRAQEAERRRLSQQMHDGPAQALSNFILQTEIAMRLFDINQDKAREELTNLKAAAGTTFQKVREFIAELRPMMLDDLGLVPTLQRYIESMKEQSSIDVRMNVMGTEQRFEPYIEVLLFRSVQELLSNAFRHSHATQVKVLLDIGPSTVSVTVEDNGRGFDLASLEEREGMGLKLIRERVEMMGGDFVVNTNIGEGTRVSFIIPQTRNFVSKV